MATRSKSMRGTSRTSSPISGSATGRAVRGRRERWRRQAITGRRGLTHDGAIDLLRQTAPKTTIYADRRFVDNGQVICSAGIAAGIDMSLHVVAGLRGSDVADRLARPGRPE